MQICPINNNLAFKGLFRTRTLKAENLSPFHKSRNSSSSVYASFAVQRLYTKKEEIPDCGEIPKSVIEKCMTGEKGPVINKKTGSPVEITACIKHPAEGEYDHTFLFIYGDGKEIGHASFMNATKDEPRLVSASDYIGDDGAIYIDYMQSDYKGTYSHVGTLMHRLLHELSKQKGYKGKMILDSTTKAASFHYDSGFIPLASFNADNDYHRAYSKLMELRIIRGMHSGSCCMCLDENKMEKLEKGEHCISPEIKNMDDDAFWELYEKVDDSMRKSDPWE